MPKDEDVYLGHMLDRAHSISRLLRRRSSDFSPRSRAQSDTKGIRLAAPFSVRHLH